MEAPAWQRGAGLSSTPIGTDVLDVLPDWEPLETGFTHGRLSVPRTMRRPLLSLSVRMTDRLQLLNIALAGFGAALGAFFAVSLRYRQGVLPANRHLAAFCACFAALMVWDIVIALFDAEKSSWVFSAADWVFLLLAPLFYCYVRELATGLRVPPRLIVLGILPGTVSLLWFAWRLAFGAAPLAAEDFMPPAYTLLYVVVACTQLIAYCTAAWWLIRQRAAAMEQDFSSFKGVDLRWLNHVMLGAALAAGVWMATAILATPLAETLNEALPPLVVLVLGLLAQRQRPLQISHALSPASDLAALAASPPAGSPAEVLTPKYAKSGLTPDRSHTLAEALQAFMAREKAFLESDLTLVELSRRCGIPAHQLSQVLNQHLGISFFEYVNRLRVAEAQRCLADPAFDAQSVLDIGLGAGFNSKAAYNAAFKRFSDSTPSQFRARARATTASVVEPPRSTG